MLINLWEKLEEDVPCDVRNIDPCRSTVSDDNREGLTDVTFFGPTSCGNCVINSNRSNTNGVRLNDVGHCRTFRTTTDVVNTTLLTGRARSTNPNRVLTTISRSERQIGSPSERPLRLDLQVPPPSHQTRLDPNVHWTYVKPKCRTL